MKILPIIVASMAMVSISNAAKITWRNNNTAFTIGDAIAAGNAVILMMADGAGTPTATWENGALSLAGGTYLGQTNLGIDGKVATTDITVTGNWSEGTVSVLGGAAYGQPGTVDAASIGYGVNNRHDYYMLVFDTSTIGETSEYALSVVADRNATSQTGAITVSFAGATLTDWTPVSVPEPTTVALLALGLAAVGLKRKVA